MAIKKNACTALKKLLTPLASEKKKILALTNSSTLPLKGQLTTLFSFIFAGLKFRENFLSTFRES